MSFRVLFSAVCSLGSNSSVDLSTEMVDLLSKVVSSRVRSNSLLSVVRYSLTPLAVSRTTRECASPLHHGICGLPNGKPSPFLPSSIRNSLITFRIVAQCKSPDTLLTKDNRLFFVTCNSCGSKRTVQAIKTGFAAQIGKRKAQKTG